MNKLIFVNLDGNGRGGPHVWSRRFIRYVETRGYRVSHDLNENWRAALFVLHTGDLVSAIQKGRTVAYRVANGYHPDWFSVMHRQMDTHHHSVNASIAQALEISPMVIYQSQWAKEQLDQHLYTRKSDFEVIYNGIDLRRFHAVQSTSTSLPTLGTVGVMRYRYRLQTFFEMSRKLEIPHRLLIVGSLDNECSQVLKDYQNDPLVGPRITYQPHVPAEELPSLYQKMTVLIHPVSGDACPNVVIEALACGVPVVAPDSGGTAEIIGPGGVIFSSDLWKYDTNFVDAMREATIIALQNTDRLSLQARRQAEMKLDIEKMIDKYLSTLGLPLRIEILQNNAEPMDFGKRIRNIGSRWISRPRFYSSIAIRKATQIYHRFQPRSANPKPRIAFTLFDFHVGGIENWLYRLARELKDQFDFYFLATKVANFLPKFSSVGTCAYLQGPSQMARFFQKNNIDLVQVHNQRWPIDAALAAGVPHVIERTDGTRSCTRVPKNGLSMVIASSAGTIPLIERLYPKERIRLIYNGIDLREVDNAPIQRPWEQEAFIIGRTSRFGRGKNLGMLIEAMHFILPTHPEAKLILVGGDSLMPGAEAIEEELRLQANVLGEAVLFAGIQEQTLPWVKGFDVGTCVSNPENEGIPNSLIEAMACSKAVISTDVDQVGELIQDGHNGLLIAPGDVQGFVQAVLRLIENPDLRQQLGTAARRTIETQFSLQHSAAQYAEVYHQLVGN